jgi:hypothetical protein
VWLHHDLAWWGVFLAVVALVLMLPMNLIANMMTSKLKDWWAARSRTALLKRRDKLIGEKNAFRPDAVLSEQQDWVIRGIRLAIVAAAMGVHLVLAAMVLLAVFLSPKNQSIQDVIGIYAMGIVFVAANIANLHRMIKRVDNYWDKVSPRHFVALEEEIHDISAKLEQRG